MSRIQVVIDEAEREEFRAQARAEGQSLSEWLREAGRQRLLQQRPGRLDTPESVEAFFAEPVDFDDMLLARRLADRHPALTARDLVHLATCINHRATDLWTYDRGLEAAWRQR